MGVDGDVDVIGLEVDVFRSSFFWIGFWEEVVRGGRMEERGRGERRGVLGRKGSEGKGEGVGIFDV